MKENKQYKLKRWYPSLDNDFEVGDIVFYDKERGCYAKPNNRDTSLRKREVENNPDFWELIEEKELLFITEDGIKITEHRTVIILVDADFMKQYKPARDCNINTVVATTKLFFHESSADEYIWKNKRVFSYQDIIEHAYNNPKYRSFIELIELAKERSKQ